MGVEGEPIGECSSDFDYETAANPPLSVAQPGECEFKGERVILVVGRHRCRLIQMKSERGRG